MKAITVEAKRSGTARLEDVAEPEPREGSVLVEAVAVGVCGTDVEIAEGKYGWAPPGRQRLVLGHESLGGVVSFFMALGHRGYRVREDFLHFVFPLEEHAERAWGRRLHLPVQLGLGTATTTRRRRPGGR